MGEDIPAVGAGSPEVEADNPAVADIPAVGVDSPEEEVDNQAGEDSLQARGDSLVAAGDSPAAAEADNSLPAAAGSPAVEEVDSSLPLEAVRHRPECRTWGKKCCPDLRACRSWGSRMRAEYRMRYRISGRGRYWRRTWGILSIVAYYLSITSAKLSMMITLISNLCLIVFLIIYSSIK